MKFTIDSATICVPDGSPVDAAVAKTTHMAIGAHQDDLEIMAMHGVLQCFGQDDKYFMGVVVSNGAGSPRDGIYAKYTDEEMQKVRRAEQIKAAFVGEYCAQAFLDYPSSVLKDGKNVDPVEDLKQVILAARPEVVYTHNLADKHDTHVATVLRTIAAIRALPKDARPKTLYGCEVWRNLDWLNDDDKVIFNVEEHENLAAALLGVFDSQIAGGKRYDLALLGRRRANATFYASHGIDDSEGLIFGINLTPLIEDDSICPTTYINEFISRMQTEVDERISKLS